MHIVESYKHLGGMIVRDGFLTADAIINVKSALSAYVPLAVRILGCPKVTLVLTSMFLWSLVLSRLLFNARVVVPSARYLRTLNAVYMRVLRRIAGHCSFGEKTISDIEVRRQLQMPSLDCFLVRARLRYLARLLRMRPASLLSFLTSRPCGVTMPWTDLVIEALRVAWRQSTLCSQLPDPLSGSIAWTDFILQDRCRWSCVIGLVFFYNSRRDRSGVPSIHVQQITLRASQ